MGRAYDNAHSRLVAGLKIALPLAALVLLSTLFLFSGRIDPSDAIPYAEVDVEELAREPRLTAPDYAGMTEDGGSLTVTAQTARPNPAGGGASATDLHARLDTAGGLGTDIRAGTGRIDPTAGLLALSGGVDVATTTGYTLHTDLLEAATDRSRLAAPGPVAGSAPFGAISAGAMSLEATGTAKDHVLVFNGGVKLIYRPQD